MVDAHACNGHGPKVKKWETLEWRLVTRTSEHSLLAMLSRFVQMNDYQPYTVNDYKKRYDDGNYWELGRLGPDLDNNQLNEKKAQKEKIRELDRQIRNANQQKVCYVVSRTIRARPNQRPIASVTRSIKFNVFRCWT